VAQGRRPWPRHRLRRRTSRIDRTRTVAIGICARPNQDGRDRDLRKDRRPVPGAGGEPRDIEPGIADADKKIRSGTTDEVVRNTPPFGDYDDIR
jgi:hypothetical protein